MTSLPSVCPEGWTRAAVGALFAGGDEADAKTCAHSNKAWCSGAVARTASAIKPAPPHRWRCSSAAATHQTMTVPSVRDREREFDSKCCHRTCDARCVFIFGSSSSLGPLSLQRGDALQRGSTPRQSRVGRGQHEGICFYKGFCTVLAFPKFHHTC